jgi:hypothetical protein
MEGVILDRFPVHALEYFYNYFIKKGYTVPYATYSGSKKSPFNGLLENCSRSDFDISKGKFFSGVEWVLSYDEMRHYAEYEGLYIVLMSRYHVNANSPTPEDLSEHYFKLVNYWEYMNRKNKISACFSFYTPHDPSSFALYLVNKVNKIPHIYVDLPWILNKYRFLSCSLRNRNLLMNNEMHRVNGLEEDFHAYTSKLKGEKNYQPMYIKAMKVRENKKPVVTLEKLIKLGFVGTVSRAFKLFKPFFNRIPVRAFFRLLRSDWSSEESDVSYFGYWLLCKRKKLFMKIKKHKYRKICIKNIPFEKFIYVALPAQPEATTLPGALHKRNVSIFLEMILTELPDGVGLCVKENMALFSSGSPYVSFIDWRSSSFYKNYKNKKNVCFVRDDVNSIELVNQSIGVACINGTVGVESVLLGKHCMIASANWYDSLNGIHMINSTSDVAKAIELMLAGEKTNPTSEQLSFDSNVLFIPSRFISADIPADDYEQLAESYLYSLMKFKLLPDEKWAI